MLNINKHIIVAKLIISVGLSFHYKTLAQKNKPITCVLFISDASKRNTLNWLEIV